jgi:hypothetical protein
VAAIIEELLPLSKGWRQQLKNSSSSIDWLLTVVINKDLFSVFVVTSSLNYWRRRQGLLKAGGSDLRTLLFYYKYLFVDCCRRRRLKNSLFF